MQCALNGYFVPLAFFAIDSDLPIQSVSVKLALVWEDNDFPHRGFQNNHSFEALYRFHLLRTERNGTLHAIRLWYPRNLSALRAVCVDTLFFCDASCRNRWFCFGHVYDDIIILFFRDWNSPRARFSVYMTSLFVQLQYFVYSWARALRYSCYFLQFLALGTKFHNSIFLAWCELFCHFSFNFNWK